MAALKTEIKEENEDDHENELEIDGEVGGDNNEIAKKKKKKKKKKKAGELNGNHNPATSYVFLTSCFVDEGGTRENVEKLGDANNIENGENGVENEGDGEGEKKKKKRNRKKGGKPVQTHPPSIPIVDLFPDAAFPLGEIQEYPTTKDDRTAKDRFTSEEKRALDRMHNDIYNEVRLAAEAHRQVSLCSRQPTFEMPTLFAFSDQTVHPEMDQARHDDDRNLRRAGKYSSQAHRGKRLKGWPRLSHRLFQEPLRRPLHSQRRRQDCFRIR